MPNRDTPAPATHPDHDRLVNAVRDWFHLPFQGMGYLAEKRRWGTFWSNGRVYTLGVPLDKVSGFVADVRQTYGQRPTLIMVDGRNADVELGPALAAAGCSVDKTDLFFAHVGQVPEAPVIHGLRIEAVDDSKLEAFAGTRLRAFANSDEGPNENDLSDEVNRRRDELTGTGRGWLARIGGTGDPVGVIWWYDEPDRVWINYLATRVLFRGRGIGQALLCRCLANGYGRGCDSAIINVQSHNTDALRLYRRLGFSDEIYWRRRYAVQR